MFLNSGIEDIYYPVLCPPSFPIPQTNITMHHTHNIYTLSAPYDMTQEQVQHVP